jgi:adenine-specific DNA-methyltransferase
MGHLPGDPEFEAAGVFHAVTKPRIETAATGKKPDGSHFSSGFEENVAFYALTYEDVNLVALGRKFDAVAPLLWLRAGAVGAVVTRKAVEPWSMPDSANYGILFDTAAAKSLANAITKREAPLAHLYIVTDSETSFRAAIAYLPPDTRINTSRLYSDYLRSFEINGRD